MLAVMRSSRSVLFAARCVTVEWQMSECYFFIFLAHTISFSTFLKKKIHFPTNRAKPKCVAMRRHNYGTKSWKTWQNNWRKRWKVHITNRPEWKWHWSSLQCGRHWRRAPLIIYNVNKNYHVRIRVLQKDRRQFCLQGDVSSTRCLSKNVSTSANFSFDKHELISIILAAKQHRPTLK